MINFYEQVTSTGNDHHNPMGDKYQIFHPFRAIISGQSGSKKTNVLLNLINNLNCFDRYYIFAKLMGNDPLYDEVLIPKLQAVEDKFGCQLLMAYTNTLDDLPDMEDIDSSYQNIFIFDDMLDESPKDLKKVSAYFTKMRKKNCSLVFVTQDFFQTPKLIRRNCNVYLFTSSVSERDLQNVYQELAKSDFASFTDFKMMFLEATAGGSVLVIDPCHPKMKYRKNFTEVWE